MDETNTSEATMPQMKLMISNKHWNEGKKEETQMKKNSCGIQSLVITKAKWMWLQGKETSC